MHDNNAASVSVMIPLILEWRARMREFDMEQDHKERVCVKSWCWLNWRYADEFTTVSLHINIHLSIC